MPVPVSVTHPGGSLAAAQNHVLETQGPFARLSQTTSTPTDTPGSDQSSTSAPVAKIDRDVASTSGMAVVTQHLSFAYPGLDGRPVQGQPPLLWDVSLSLPTGSSCLLLGANGAGKTTLLKILGGKHMVPEEQVTVSNHSPFRDTQLTTSGDLAYIGGNWTRDVAFAGYSVPLAGDFPASRMINAVPGVDPARRAHLVKVLDVDLEWRMHQVSDGQRRRVQLCVGLLRPFKVLLLDEITVDLDVLGRAELMRFLSDECRTRGATILYATHIFDGLESWPSHVAFLSAGRLQMLKPASEIPELAEGRLLGLVERLLREEKARQPPRCRQYDPQLDNGTTGAFSYVFNNGWVPGTLGSSLANSSNAVMRS